MSHLQQYVAAYQQHVAAYQQLASDKELLQRQVLVQTQLMDRLQNEDIEVKVAAEKARQELEETQVRAFEGSRAGPPRGGPATSVSLLTLFWPLRDAWKLPPSRTSSSRPS